MKKNERKKDLYIGHISFKEYVSRYKIIYEKNMKIKKNKIKFFVGDFFIFKKSEFKKFLQVKLNMNVRSIVHLNMNYSLKN